MRSNAGYIRQQTVNCDYITCSKTVTAVKVAADNVQANNIESPIIEELYNQLNAMQNEINILNSKMRNLQTEATASFTMGSTVVSTLHFDDVDLLSMSEEELANYQLEIRARLASAADVPIEQIVIIDLASTGSATARIEIKYPETEDKVANEAQSERKRQLLERLNDPLSISDILGDSLGEVQVMNVNEGEIKSLTSKLSALEARLTDFTLEDVKSLRLDTYKFEVDGDTLNIVRYDHDVGAYVGGTLNIDH